MCEEVPKKNMWVVMQKLLNIQNCSKNVSNQKKSEQFKPQIILMLQFWFNRIFPKEQDAVIYREREEIV